MATSSQTNLLSAGEKPPDYSTIAGETAPGPSQHMPYNPYQAGGYQPLPPQGGYPPGNPVGAPPAGAYKGAPPAGSYPTQYPAGYGTGQVPSYTAVTVTQPSVVIVGGCPACRVGALEDDFTCLGVCCAIFFFPLGILCCLAMRQRRCPNCGAVFG